MLASGLSPRHSQNQQHFESILFDNAQKSGYIQNRRGQVEGPGVHGLDEEFFQLARDDNDVPMLPQMPLVLFQMCVTFLTIFPMWKWASSGDHYQRSAHIALGTIAYYLCACLSLVITICCILTNCDMFRNDFGKFIGIHIANCVVGVWSLLTCYAFMKVANKCAHSWMVDISRTKYKRQA